MFNIFKKLSYQKNNYHLEQPFLDYINISQSDKVGVKSYSNNVVVHKCVNLIAEAASHVPWIIRNKAEHKQKHDPCGIINLLKNPNHYYSGAEFIFKIIADKLLYGNAYITFTNYNNPKLIILDPEKIEIIIEEGKLTGYKYRNGNKNKIFKINPRTGLSNILHIKNYNPNSDIYGISSLEAAKKAVKLHDNANDWNNALLKNGARPSGALSLKDGTLTETQFKRLKEQLEDKYSGISNSSKPLLLEGGLEWQEMSIRPKDMDFLESINMAMRQIAMAFNVPIQLLGIKGDNTYSNMQEARLAFWEDTMIPLLTKLSYNFSGWFSNIYDKTIDLHFDLESISALTNKRQNLWSKISSANFMTINEKRAIVGLPPIKNGYEL